ncbi:anti-adapter protein IraP [Yokenella regensburgei]|uniref:anti-adapter protein IraP n=1 Tax=Yokenella regensburgei TaxID=158877 RepID=UPI003F184B72
MKNLIAELLVKLAQKEEESKELVAQVEALEIVVTALLRQMAQPEQQALIDSIEGAMDDISPDSEVPPQDRELLQQYLKKLLRHPRNQVGKEGQIVI